MDSLKYSKIREDICKVHETLLYIAFLFLWKFFSTNVVNMHFPHKMLVYVNISECNVFNSLNNCVINLERACR